jgi:hypothetical protein
MRTLILRSQHRAATTEEQLNAQIEHRDTVIRRQAAELLHLHERNAALLAANLDLVRQLRAAEAELRNEPIRLVPVRVTTVSLPADRLTATDIPQLAATAA